ncbi:MAG: hypothetical protein QGF59_19400, partial [Pirellulaceae bacterium]|nr:hypothetical protein [Pirellulaceae bacterium]
LSGTAGLSFITGDGTSDANMVFTGTIANINTALDGLTFDPTPDFDGAASLQIITDDQGNTGPGGAQTDNDTIAITVNAVNDLPLNSVPGAQATNEDTALVFDTVGGNLISISDPDAGSSPVEVMLSATNGTVTITKTIGGEFQVNTTTADDQKEADVATDANGNYVVVWASKGQDGDGPLEHNVYARLYGVDGTPQSGEILVNTSSGDQKKAAVAMDVDGDFVVVWESGPGGAKDVFARQFDSFGTAQGGEISVNTTTSEDQKEPDVAVDDAGNFAVVWQSKGQDGDTAQEENTYFRLYDAAATPQIGETRVNTTIAGKQKKASLAMDADGDFVVIWEGNGDQPGNIDAKGVFFQRYDSTGAAQGGETRVNTTTANDEKESDVAIDPAGNFVVVWESKDMAPQADVYFQRFDAAGSKQGIETLVNTTTSGDQKRPAVSMDTTGDFVIVWEGNGGRDDKGVYAQQYDSVGAAQGNEFLVNRETADKQERAKVATYDNGDLVVVWGSKNQDGDKAGVFAQQLLRHEAINFSVGDGEADMTMTFTGKIEDINHALDGVTFAPTPDFNGAASLQIITDDQGNTGSGGPLSDDDTIAITVGAVNDNPVNSVPGPQATDEDTPLVFNAGGGNLISVSDVDAGGSPLQVTLNGTNGLVTLSGTAGLTFSAGDGTSDASMTFTGTLGSINAALDGLTFAPTPDFNGAASVQIITDDQGNTGSG